jgi:hypothetical protein
MLKVYLLVIVKGKVASVLNFEINHYAMKAYGGSGGMAQSLLSSVLLVGE